MKQKDYELLHEFYLRDRNKWQDIKFSMFLFKAGTTYEEWIYGLKKRICIAVGIPMSILEGKINNA